MSFSDLQLPDFLLHAVKACHFEKPTPIQEQAIPVILEGKDLIAQAQTGTGKTAAFALALLKLISEMPPKKKKISVCSIVLAPTRELALQIAREFRLLGQFSAVPMRIVPLIGGEDIKAQIKLLHRGVEVVVATPGRLLEIIRLKELRVNELAHFILDEADKMLALGFADEINEILTLLPKNRQNMLFSATISKKVVALAESFLKEPVTIRLTEEKPTIDTISQRVIEVDEVYRGPLLRQLIETEQWGQTLVFVASKRAATNLAAKLNKHGISTIEFHGNLTQEERIEALRQFKNHNYLVMIATDIAARGIDIPKLTHVVNYDLPRAATDYIHRIGRTGRAEESGVAVTFISAKDQNHYAMIERVAKIKLEREHFSQFPYTALVQPSMKGKAPIKGKRPNKKDKLRAQKAAEAAANVTPETDSL